MWTIPGLVGLVLMLIASAETNGGNQQSLRFETDLKFDDTEMLQEVNSIQICNHRIISLNTNGTCIV